MRRQTAAGEGPLAGSSRGLRLDPHTLPVRFSAEDTAADGRMRTIELDRERVLLSRTVGGVHMRLHLPLASFLGVAVRIISARDRDAKIAITLEHRDSELSVPLHVATETSDVIADWQLWGSILRKKLLVAESDGTWREPFETLGPLMLGRVGARRLRRSVLRKRRPKVFRRRGRARPMDEMTVYRGEREIIAPE